MLVRVQMIGGGAMHDPRRVPLPTWDLLGIDQVNEQMIIHVPDEDFPDGILKDPELKQHQLAEGPVLLGLSKAGLQAWHEHLDQRYGEHHGEYRPQLV